MYVREQKLLSDYVAPYVQFCMSNSLHVADNLLRLFYFNEKYKYTIML